MRKWKGWEGKVGRIHADVSTETGKKRREEAKNVDMNNNRCEATDLSRDGISHLKMQNTLHVKPHKHPFTPTPQTLHTHLLPYSPEATKDFLQWDNIYSCWEMGC